MNFDGAVENFFGCARHVDTVIIPPFDEEISALQVNRHFPFGAAGQNSRNADRRSARAASPRLSGSPFPNSHFHLVGTQYFDKFRIYPLGEKGMMLEAGTDFFQVQGINVI
jgi:hypothetical protein